MAVELNVALTIVIIGIVLILGGAFLVLSYNAVSQITDVTVLNASSTCFQDSPDSNANGCGEDNGTYDFSEWTGYVSDEGYAYDADYGTYAYDACQDWYAYYDAYYTIPPNVTSAILNVKYREGGTDHNINVSMAPCDDSAGYYYIEPAFYTNTSVECAFTLWCWDGSGFTNLTYYEMP